MFLLLMGPTEETGNTGEKKQLTSPQTNSCARIVQNNLPARSYPERHVTAPHSCSRNVSCILREHLTRDWDWKLVLHTSVLTFHEQLIFCRIHKRERREPTNQPRSSSWEGGTRLFCTIHLSKTNAKGTTRILNVKLQTMYKSYQTNWLHHVHHMGIVHFFPSNMYEKQERGRLDLLSCKGGNLKMLWWINTIKYLVQWLLFATSVFLTE